MQTRSYPILVGQRVHRLVVVSEEPATDEGRMWLCRCDCGGTSILSTRRFNRGTTKSCGCYRRERSAQNTGGNVTHGHSPRGASTPTYRTWRSMLGRCLNPTDYNYARYGGRGITVHEPWQHNFEAFLADMGERPDGHSLDRIDVDGNYEPANCRWATDLQQRRENKSNVKLDMDKAREIRTRAGDGESYVSLALAFGISDSHAYRIAVGHKWIEDVQS